ncbi:MAG: Uma2 family endonuclease [Ruminococcus sp.]|jgi:Uma2 family endonuclease|nr:Uma2 family endonuclease [Ruminococcus sp.]
MSENKQEVRTQTVVPKDFTCSSGRTQEDSFVAEAAAAYNIGQKDGEYTLKDYYALPDDIRAELIDGHLIYMDAPTTRHQGIIAELYFQISSYIRARKGPCKALFSPLDVRLDNDDKTMLQPDLIILCDEAKDDGKRIDGAPDFVAEVVSPSSVKKDYLIKLNKYWNANVREYWIIDPKKQTVSTYYFDADGDVNVTHYTFGEQVPVRIFEDLMIDFTEF